MAFRLLPAAVTDIETIAAYIAADDLGRPALPTPA
jgi:hypothetical protein